MACSGISIASECDKAHERQQKKPKDVQWTVYRIDDITGKPKVVVDCSECRSFSANQATNCEEKGEAKTQSKDLWKKFIDELPDTEPRYAVYDYVQPTKSGTFKDEMRFIAWCPENSSIKTKMIYSSTKDYLKKKLNINKETFLSTKSSDDIDDAFEDLMALV